MHGTDVSRDSVFEIGPDVWVGVGIGSGFGVGRGTGEDVVFFALSGALSTALENPVE